MERFICSVPQEFLTVDNPVPYRLFCRASTGGYIASVFEMNIYASGESASGAIENLQDMVGATFSLLSSIGLKALGPGPTGQLKLLQRYISYREQVAGKNK